MRHSRKRTPPHNLVWRGSRSDRRSSCTNRSHSVRRVDTLSVGTLKSDAYLIYHLSFSKRTVLNAGPANALVRLWALLRAEEALQQPALAVDAGMIRGTLVLARIRNANFLLTHEAVRAGRFAAVDHRGRTHAAEARLPRLAHDLRTP